MRAFHKSIILIILLWLLVFSPLVIATAQIQNSYIIVHALNPEGVEIASIQGMDQDCVEIYDGDTLIGYGPDSIAISSGPHLIKAKFNSITLEEEINCNIGETKEIIFTFERTVFNLTDCIYDCDLSSSISGSWSGQKPKEESMDTLPDLNWTTKVHFEEPVTCGEPPRSGNYAGEVLIINLRRYV